MKKNVDGDKITLTIVVIIVLIIIGYILYNVLISKKTLQNNTSIDTNLEVKQTEVKNTPSIPDKKNYLSETDNTKSSSKNMNDVNEISNIPKELSFQEQTLASFSTSIYDKDENRVLNITLANSKLNGTIVKPGEEFSFNNTIGPMDETHGFKKALGFDSNGKKIKISGGGLCQISSTIYNAALIANLEIVERHPHSRRVYYVPQDKDATIVYGSLDFKFKNSTDKNIKIESSNDSNTVTIKLIQF